MSEVSKKEEALVVPVAIKRKFDFVLIQEKFQEIVDRLSKYSFEDNEVEKLKLEFDNVNKVVKKFDDVHKKGKAEALLIGKLWDTAKRQTSGYVLEITEPFRERYVSLCEKIAKRAAEAKAEIERQNRIKEGIQSNVLAFTNEIANANTIEDLLAVERKINLEKGRKTKYEEFFDDAVKSFENLTENLKNQKQKIKDLEDLKKKEEEAINSGDDELAFELKSKKESMEESIQEQKENIQDSAIQSLEQSNLSSASVQQVFPSVSAKRTTWKFVIHDEAELIKKAPKLAVISLNTPLVKDVLAELKTSGALKGKTEFIKDGIKYFEDKSY